jgi:hypothetical protein
MFASIHCRTRPAQTRITMLVLRSASNWSLRPIQRCQTLQNETRTIASVHHLELTAILPRDLRRSLRSMYLLDVVRLARPLTSQRISFEASSAAETPLQKYTRCLGCPPCSGARRSLFAVPLFAMIPSGVIHSRICAPCCPLSLLSLSEKGPLQVFQARLAHGLVGSSRVVRACAL